jgi:hypothetical protein
MSYKIKKTDWEKIYYTMNKYNRQSGFIDILDDKLTFFDGNPNINNVSAFYITKSEVETYLSNWEDI